MTVGFDDATEQLIITGGTAIRLFRSAGSSDWGLDNVDAALHRFLYTSIYPDQREADVYVAQDSDGYWIKRQIRENLTNKILLTGHRSFLIGES